MRNVYYLLLALIIFGSSCQTKDSSNADEVADFDDQTEKIDNEREASVPTLPAPDVFAARLQSTGADYVDSNINDAAKVSQYLNGPEEKVAVNLGVYLANLAYSSAYRESETSTQLLNSIVELSSSLGIERGIMSGIAERYNNNSEVPDSVKNYLRQMSDKAHDNLRASGRDRLAAIAYAGFYIEGLNMALNIVSSYPEDFPTELRQQLLVPIYHYILSQKDNIGMIKTYLEANIEGVQETPYFNDLNKMEKIYSEIDYEKILNSQDLNYIETDEKINELAQTIREMRARIVE